MMTIKNKHKNLIILGIDPGYDRLGISIVKKLNGKDEIIYSECFQTDKKKSESERIHKIGDHIKELIEKWGPQEAAIEKLFFVANQKTGIAVAKTVGVIAYVLEEAGVPLFYYAPTEIKTAIASHGRADKKDIHLMVSRLVVLPKRKMLDDEIDSIAIALTHLAMVNYRKLTS